MSATSVERFQQVQRVDEPGRYVFATDPNDRFKPCIFLPDGSRPTHNVPGARPILERMIPAYLGQRYPAIMIVETETFRSGWNPRKHSSLRLRFSPWRHQSGILRLDQEFCEMFRGSRGGNGADIPVICFRDVARPEITGGSLLRPGRNGTDGQLELELSGGGEHINWDERGPFWRGYLTLQGGNFGWLVRNAVDYISDTLSRLDSPVWRDLSFTPPALRT